MINHDPIEDTPEYKAISEELEAKIRAEIGEKRGMGFCHLYWSTKRRILKEEYGIDWKSPSQLNPHILFD